MPLANWGRSRPVPLANRVRSHPVLPSVSLKTKVAIHQSKKKKRKKKKKRPVKKTCQARERAH